MRKSSGGVAALGEQRGEAEPGMDRVGVAGEDGLELADGARDLAEVVAGHGQCDPGCFRVGIDPQAALEDRHGLGGPAP